MRLLCAGLAALLLISGTSFLAQQKPEATSLLGRPLVPPPIPAERARQLQDDLTRAEVVYGRNPDDADATIWLDGRFLGRSGRVWALGPPHDGQLLVVARDGRRVRSTVARRVSAGTVQFGFYTLGACFLFCWAYPQQIHVVLPPAPPPVSWDDDAHDNPWLAPPDGWGEVPQNQ